MGPSTLDIGQDVSNKISDQALILDNESDSRVPPNFASNPFHQASSSSSITHLSPLPHPVYPSLPSSPHHALNPSRPNSPTSGDGSSHYTFASPTLGPVNTFPIPGGSTFPPPIASPPAAVPANHQSPSPHTVLPLPPNRTATSLTSFRSIPAYRLPLDSIRESPSGGFSAQMPAPGTAYRQRVSVASPEGRSSFLGSPVPYTGSFVSPPRIGSFVMSREAISRPSPVVGCGYAYDRARQSAVRLEREAIPALLPLHSSPAMATPVLPTSPPRTTLGPPPMSPPRPTPASPTIIAPTPIGSPAQTEQTQSASAPADRTRSLAMLNLVSGMPVSTTRGRLSTIPSVSSRSLEEGRAGVVERRMGSEVEDTGRRRMRARVSCAGRNLSRWLEGGLGGGGVGSGTGAG
ncbi:unnamed protein product [Zymoseptoria tritici ST99CH_3D1]|uniref:Uncharacterized protein n=1 Tax=Zymoseptoria tritici ST99CH_1E4 TaxID=1276532 RepID=A0A2H1FJM2_ZYMTR|nr:unnamed protein product [Zymoseptoria tritici ST99CH_1E4]SMR43719.1 unnamed protein product [Zymoseptoria tritici ST99CH_3D1]